MTSSEATVPDLLARLLRGEAGRPLVTFYDDATGERVELSVTTWANWVAKAAGLLVDELGLEKGDAVRVDLPPHWLSTVFCGAAWAAGLVVTDADDPEAVVCGPDTLERWAPDAVRREVLACSLRPLGVRFAEGVPDGVHDVGVEVWGMPDAFVALDPPAADDVATRFGGRETTQQALLEAAAAGTLVRDGDRLLSGADPASPPGTASLVEPLLRSGSLVLVTRAEPDRLEEIASSERVTARFPA
ncbi:MAG: TIGR03089 family protein [Nocardioides sp.]|nr:TIGR03089 family protein [Nocardioides sp.]